MKLSFVIPALNEEQFIGKCISSILPQLGPQDEIIVVDNGSTDRTIQIAKAYEIKVTKEKKKGISHARNHGAEVAQGNIICFIDADGVLGEKWVENVRRGFSNNKVKAIVGINIFTHGNIYKFLMYNSYTLFGYSGLVLLKEILGNVYLSGNNIAIRKSVFQKLGGFDPVVGEDYWLSKKFWKLKDKSAKFDLNMVVWYSSRGFDSAGYYKTLQLWMKSAFQKIPQEKYKFDNKEL